ncbi:DUF397 domain-containing protein [Streptomyces sp. NPDC085927]|uniref:DUF397 domain-containing protein n=1 Tax=Streptomyces sp. NPDC085927 TaxID=3365738 RepID=UPI0037D18982
MKSSCSNTSGECVEVAPGPLTSWPCGIPRIPHGPILRLAATTWAEFTASLG